MSFKFSAGHDFTLYHTLLVPIFIYKHPKEYTQILWTPEVPVILAGPH